MPKIRKEPLIPIGLTLECDCGAEMECMNPQALDEFVYSCPKCGATYTYNLLLPRITYITKEEMLKELNEQNKQSIANEIEEVDDEISKKQQIKELLEKGDFEALTKMGVQIVPVFPNQNEVPS